MAPVRVLSTLFKRRDEFSSVRSQWENPNDVLTVLMIIGGDIVQRAISQLAGVGVFTPIAFSFGWVAYSFTAVMAAFGDCRLMSMPDGDCMLINVQSGQTRDNKSWTLGRLVRDHEPRGSKRGPLTITFFNVNEKGAFCTAQRDWVFWTSTAIMVLQFGVACIPGARSSNWLVLILFVGGTILAQLTSALPQWKAEKWGARPSSDKRTVVCLTRGNGSSSVLVIISEPNVGLRFEDLAGGAEVYDWLTGPMTILLATLWILHLITTQGLSSDGWFTLVVGALGMVQNILAAGVRRTPAALGLPLDEIPSRSVVQGEKEKVFDTLRKADSSEPGVGLALLDVFFPGGLREEEQEWRETRKKEIALMKANDKRARAAAADSESGKSTLSHAHNATSDTVPTTQ